MWGTGDIDYTVYPMPVLHEDRGFEVPKTYFRDNINGIQYLDADTIVAVGDRGFVARAVPSLTGYCDDTASYLAVPQPAGFLASVNRYTLHAYDAHDNPDRGDAERQGIDTTDVPFTVDSFIATDDPVMTAGASDTVDFLAVLSDDNGDGSIYFAEAYLYDADTVTINASGYCDEDQNDCYFDEACTINDAYGTSTQVELACSAEVYFNANDGTNWDIHLNSSDGSGWYTNLNELNSDIDVAALSAVEAVEPSVQYGTLLVGASSAGQTLNVANYGNQPIDITVAGSDMCTDYPTCAGNSIAKGQQKWTQADGSDFTWASQGHALLASGSAGYADTEGCANVDLLVREVAAETTENEALYWKLRIPDVQPRGDYTGENTVSFITNTACLGTP
jgi:hypothetical protein